MNEVTEQIDSIPQSADNTAAAKVKKVKKKRIWEIDLIRGICVLLMIFDHTMFDVRYFGNVWHNNDMRNAGFSYWTGDLRGFVWPIVVFLFIFISGISSTFSKSNFTRALQTLTFAYVISAVTSFVPNLYIRFGVLHALGFSMLIYAVLDFFDKSIYSKLAAGLCIVILGVLKESGNFLEVSLLLIIIGFLILITFGAFFEKKVFSKHVIAALSLISAGILIIIIKSLVDGAVSLRMPESFQWLNNVIGYREGSFSISADYFALIPFVGIFLLGSVFAKLFYQERKSLLPKLDTKFTKPVEYIGRHALIIYVVHQVVIYGIFVLIALICGYTVPL